VHARSLRSIVPVVTGTTTRPACSLTQSRTHPGPVSHLENEPAPHYFVNRVCMTVRLLPAAVVCELLAPRLQGVLYNATY
jgi:hypothetical protein